MSGDVGAAGLAASLVLVVIALGLIRWQRLDLEGRVVAAVARSLVQLLIVGWALTLVLDGDAPLIWSWPWVVAMTGVASYTVARRAPDVERIWAIAAVALISTVAVSLLVIFGLDIFPLEGRTLVPLTGMIVGNSMSAGVLAAQRVVDEFAGGVGELEARLALGAAPEEASRRFVRSALRTAVTPQIETTKALGLVVLPGAMTGLVLAGVDPLDAVMVQLAIMYLILGSVTIVATVIAVGCRRRLFTPDERLVELVRK